MRLRSFRVFVTDFAAARRFYEGVLGLTVAWEWQDQAIGFDVGVELVVELVGADADLDDRAMVGGLPALRSASTMSRLPMPIWWPRA